MRRGFVRMMRRLALTALVGAASIAAGTPLQPPTLGALTTVDPNAPTAGGPHGPPRALVQVAGANLDLGWVVWDAGLTGERRLPVTSGGATMFSVPFDAAANTNHNVAIENARGRSTPLTYHVDAAVPFPKPRIDSVMLAGAMFDGFGHVFASLYVQGANLDVGAVVQVNGQDVATIAHKALTTDWHHVPAGELDWPIYHYLSTVAVSGPRGLGEGITITVRNPGQPFADLTSDAVTYKLPTGPADMDSDGDGVPDTWEINGHAGLNFQSMNANPHRRDIFVHVDIMPAAAPPSQAGLQHPPGKPVFDAAKAMFLGAPILNPVDLQGINLFVEIGSAPYWPIVCFEAGGVQCSEVPSLGIRNFTNIKVLDAARNGVFHYALWARHQSSNDAGLSDFGDDFVISFDDWGEPQSAQPGFVHSTRSQVEAFVHELGHDLGQYHGGLSSGPDYSANYWSVMSLTWALRTGKANQFRAAHATCPAAYYMGSGGEAPDGTLTPGISNTVDYSEGMARALINAGELSPPAVICGRTVDWFLDQGGNHSEDFPNWANLSFKGPQGHGQVPWPVPPPPLTGLNQ